MRVKKDKVQKPVAPVQRALRITWMAWLITAAIIYPAAVMVATGASLWAGIGVQILGLIPALLCTVSIHRGNSPYALMWVSMVALVYLGVAGVMSLFKIYEGAPMAVWTVQVLEMILLLMINCQLFVLLKRLPAMHKSL